MALVLRNASMAGQPVVGVVSVTTHHGLVRIVLTGIMLLPIIAVPGIQYKKNFLTSSVYFLSKMIPYGRAPLIMDEHAPRSPQISAI